MLRRPHRRRDTRILVLLLFCLPATTQSVPASSPQKLSLSLRQAVLIALKQRPQQIIALLQVPQGGHESQIARVPLLPQADLYASAGLSQYNFQGVEHLPAPKAAGPYQHIEGGTAFSQALNLPAIRRYQIGREGVLEARASENISRENVTAVIVTQYLLVLRAIADYLATSARVALAERLYNQAVEQRLVVAQARLLAFIDICFCLAVAAAIGLIVLAFARWRQLHAVEHAHLTCLVGR